MTTRGPAIVLAISHSATPPTAYVREMNVDDLYSALNMWIGARARWGRGRNATEFRNGSNRQIGRIRRELNRRGLPSSRQLYDAEQREADAAYERETVEDVRYGGCP